MKTLLTVILCVLGASLQAETFTNLTSNGWVILTTVSTNARPKNSVSIPPMPPGMSASVPKLTRSKPTHESISVKAVKAIPIRSFMGSNSIVFLGKLGPATNKFVHPKAFMPASVGTTTGPSTNTVEITSTNNVPILFDFNVVILCHVTTIKATQLASNYCNIEYTGDFQSSGVNGEFWESPVQRDVYVNWIVPVTEDLPHVFWWSVNFHK